MPVGRVKISRDQLAKIIADMAGVPPNAIHIFKSDSGFSATYIAAPALASDGAMQNRVETLLHDLRREYVLTD